MLLFDRDISGVRCAVWHVTESMDELLMLLPDDGKALWREAQTRFRSDARRKEWIAVRVLLHTLLHTIKSDAPRIIYADNGAPLLDGSNTHISISHTKGYVCVALSDECRIGVDIEQTGNRVERVRSRFVHEEENVITLNQLLVAWSAKESAFKLLQRTEVDFKEQLRIVGMPHEDRGTFLIRYMNDADVVDCTVAYEVFPDFVLTVAREG